MRLTTIWTFPGLPLTERVIRTRDWFAMTTAHRLPRRLAYWSFIDTGVRHMENDVVPEVSVYGIAGTRRARGGADHRRRARVSEQIKRTPDEWGRLVGISVMDPDGWRHDMAKPWDEPLTWTDYLQRVWVSTIDMSRAPDRRILHAAEPPVEVTE